MCDKFFYMGLIGVVLAGLEGVSLEEGYWNLMVSYVRYGLDDCVYRSY